MKKGQETPASPRLMYVLRREIKVRSRWPLPQTVNRVVSQSWNRHVQEAFERAVRTAR